MPKAKDTLCINKFKADLIIQYIIFNQFSTLHNDLSTVDVQIIHFFVQLLPDT
jgi:hypothetical protein